MITKVASSRPVHSSILEKGHGKKASNFTFIKILKLLGCATNQDTAHDSTVCLAQRIPAMNSKITNVSFEVVKIVFQSIGQLE